MLFNRVVSKFGCALVLTGVALLSSCSLKLNDPVQKNKMNVNLGGGCLSQSGVILGHFADGTASEAELNGFWDCADKSFTTFSNHTEGDTANTYKGTDIARFLSKYFLKGKEVPSGLLLETMALKQALLGGSADTVSRKELADLMRLMKAGRQFTLRMRPLMPFSYNTITERGYSKEQFEQAISEFQSAMAEMGDALKDSQGTYSLDHFALFINEFGKFLYNDGDPRGAWVKTMVKWSVALRPAKAIFISPPKDEIRASDWTTIYQMGPRYYSLYLRARFYLRGQDSYLYGEGLDRLESLFDDSVKLLNLVLDQRPSGEVKSEEIDELLLALNEAELLPQINAQGLKAAGEKPKQVGFDTARAAVKLLFGKFFRAHETSEKTYTISKENFGQLSRNFHFATEGLRALEALYRSKLGDDGYLRLGIAAEEIAAASTDKLLDTTFLKDQTSRAAVESLKKSATEINTVFPGEWMHVYVSADGKKPKLSLAHMAKIHLLRSFNRLVIDAYAGPKANSLNTAQLNALIGDVFPLVQEAGYADEKTKKEIPNLLFQASLLLPSSDGDTGLTINEATEFESLLLSTVFHAKRMHTKLAELCKAQKFDDKGSPTIDADCYRAQWLKSSAKIWSYIPGLATYFKRLPERDQEAFFGRLEHFLRKGRSSKEDFTLGDTRSFLLLPYYVEFLFARFDVNHNGLLENTEADAAYPVFQPFLAAKASAMGKTDPKDHHAIYMYLLAYRELPSAATWGDALSYAWHRYIAGDKDFQADRGQVVEIFEKLLTLQGK